MEFFFEIFHVSFYQVWEGGCYWSGGQRWPLDILTGGSLYSLLSSWSWTDIFSKVFQVIIFNEMPRLLSIVGKYSKILVSVKNKLLLLLSFYLWYWDVLINVNDHRSVSCSGCSNQLGNKGASSWENQTDEDGRKWKWNQNHQMIVEFPLLFAFVMLTFQKGDYKTRQKPKDNKVTLTYQNVVLFEIICG